MQRSKPLPEREVTGFSRFDHTVLFYNFVSALICPNMIVLDFGAGTGSSIRIDTVPYRRALRTLRGKVHRLIGVDVESGVLENSYLDEAYVTPRKKATGYAIPLGDESVDLVVSDWVFEHIDEPYIVERELYRVLKPGGWICARTPNRWGYIAIGNRILPAYLKHRMLAILQPNRRMEDVFPAFYRLNSYKQLRKTFRPERWSLYTFNVPTEPSYAGNSKFIYSIFLMLDKITPEPLLPVRLIFLKKLVQTVAR